MTTQEIENPVLNLRNLNELEHKILHNEAVEKDYETLDTFISSLVGEKGFLINKLHENKISDFQEFIYERKKIKESTSSILLSTILGIFLASLSALKTYSKTNNL